MHNSFLSLQNANPAYSTAAISPSSLSTNTTLPRVGSPLFRRGSMGRSLSESSDIDEATFERVALSVASSSSSLLTPTTPSSSSSNGTFFSEPTTPCARPMGSSSGDLTKRSMTTSSTSSTPPRRPSSTFRDLTSRDRDNGKRVGGGSGSGSGVTQTRLQQYFAVKRRSSTALGASTSNASNATPANKPIRPRKRINFDA